MPFEWLLRRWIAVNQAVSGSLLPCITVPAVTEVCRPQPAHSQVNRFPKFPAPHPAASRADEPDRPTPLKQMPRACRFVRKTLCELSTRHRTIMLPPARHENIIGTSSGYRQAISLRCVPSLDGPEPKG